METEEQARGSFKLLRTFLGSIAGGLSSLASLPFGKREKSGSPVLAELGPSSSTGVDLSVDDLSKLYPDTELSETRKRARLSWDEVFEDIVGFQNSNDGKFSNVKGLEENLEMHSGHTLLGFDRVSTPSNDVQYTADKMLDDAFPIADGVPDGACSEIGAQLVPNVFTAVRSKLDRAVLGKGENLDECLASFRTTIKRRRDEEQKQVDNISNEDTPRKKVRFGETTSVQLIGSMPIQTGDVSLNEGSTKAKRKRVDVAEDKNEKRPRSSTLDGEPIRPEGRISTVGMSSILTRKRRRANDDDLFSNAATADLRLKKDKRSKVIGEPEKLVNSEGASSVSNDEHFSKAAVACKAKEVGNLSHSTSAHTMVPKESAFVPVDETWRVFVSNTPTDVKDEELFDLFSVSGSLKLEAAAVKVLRDSRTGLSKGTAYVFFKTEDDLNSLLSSRRSFKLRGRLLRISRAVASERKSKQLRQVKRPADPETEESDSLQKRLKVSLVKEGETAANKIVLTRSRSSRGSDKGQLDVISSFHSLATEQSSNQSWPAKRLKGLETNDSNSSQKQLKPSALNGGEAAAKQHTQKVTQILTRSGRSSGESGKEQLGVLVASSQDYTEKRIAADLSPHKNFEESPQAKRKRVEKNQRGISRSKKIRRK